MSENSEGSLPAIHEELDIVQPHSTEKEVDFPIMSLPLNLSDEARAKFEEEKKRDPNGCDVPEIRRSNEPTSEELEVFFEDPSQFERLIVCPDIPKDITDDAGLFGTEPGYLFVTKRRRTTNEVISEEMFAKGAHPIMESPHGSVVQIEHYDFFPRFKYSAQIITPQRAPKTFQFLNGYLDISNPRFRSEDIDPAYNNPQESPSEQLPPSNNSSVIRNFLKGLKR